jgi:hypothetical protein
MLRLRPLLQQPSLLNLTLWNVTTLSFVLVEPMSASTTCVAALNASPCPSAANLLRRSYYMRCNTDRVAPAATIVARLRARAFACGLRSPNAVFNHWRRTGCRGVL